MRITHWHRARCWFDSNRGLDNMGEHEQRDHVAATVYYVAHPVSGDVEGNVRRALRWLRYLRARWPDVVFVMPWVAALLAGEDDRDPAQRERGLRDCEVVAARCDGIVLCGGRISHGMRRELAAVVDSGRGYIDLTNLGAEPPA